MSNMDEGNSDEVGRSAVKIDEIGFRILGKLRDNGRISIAALAESVGISRSNAYQRVEALTAAGVITGYSATIDPVRAGLGICALVFVNIRPQAWPTFLDAIREMPEIESAKVTTGEHDMMLLLRGKSVEGVHAFVVGVVAALEEVKSVETVLVLDEVFDRGRILATDLPNRTDVARERGLLRYTRANPDRPGAY